MVDIYTDHFDVFFLSRGCKTIKFLFVITWKTNQSSSGFLSFILKVLSLKGFFFSE